jgi:hypothetical protein
VTSDPEDHQKVLTSWADALSAHAERCAAHLMLDRADELLAMCKEKMKYDFAL